MQKQYKMHPTTFLVLAKKSLNGGRLPFRVLTSGPNSVYPGNNVVLDESLEGSNEAHLKLPEEKFVTYGPEDIDWLSYFGLLVGVEEKIGPVMVGYENIRFDILVNLDKRQTTIFEPQKMEQRK